MRDGTRRIQEMKESWSGLLERRHIRDALGPGAELEGRHLAWPIPARVDRVPLAAGRVLFTGDAAAASDVMTGEGIGQALLSGRVAAEAVLEAGALRPAMARARYEREVSHHLVADHKMSVALGRVLAHERGRVARSRSSIGPATGDAATSPAGCSRTSHGRCCSRRAAGTATCSPDRAPHVD